MSEVSSRQATLQSVITALGSLLDKGGHDVPDWVAQELTFSQMRLLFLLSKHGPSPMSRIADWLGIGLPTASGIVERVERHGLVYREHRLDDRRVVECGLTNEGNRLIDEISGTRLEMMRRLLDVLDDEELAEMARIVTVMVGRLKATGP
jgi:DNA-binding MarR family transcriptional regulator